MKLVYSLSSLKNSGGTERTIVNKLNEFVNLNYQILVLIHSDNDCSSFYELDPRIDVRSVKCKSKIQTVLNIIRFLYKEKPDYFISVGQLEKIVGLFYTGKSLIEWHFCYNQPVLESVAKGVSGLGFYKAKLKCVCNKVISLFYTKVIVLTDEDIFRWRIRDNVICIPNAIFEMANKNKPAASATKLKLISVGRLEYQKGIVDMIDIMTVFDEKNVNWELNVFGEGSLKSELQKYVNINKLTEKVNFMGAEADIASKYLESDVYLMTSYYEGLPMVLIEALNLNTPVISFDCQTGPKYLIENNVNGYLIENRDKVEFANKLSLFVHDKSGGLTDIGFIKNKSKLMLNNVINSWVSLFNERKI